MEQLNFYPFDFLKVILAGSVAMRALTNHKRPLSTYV